MKCSLASRGRRFRRPGQSPIPRLPLREPGKSGQKYDAMAYLAEQLFALPASDPTYSGDAAKLQYAIWDILIPQVSHRISRH